MSYGYAILATNKNLFLACLYIWHEKSLVKKEEIVFFKLILEDIIRFKARGDVVLLGDCNSRTGDVSDWIDSSDQVDSILDSLSETDRSVRLNIDTGINNYGRQLISLCKITGLQIRNGRHGSNSNHYTCYRHNIKARFIILLQYMKYQE